MGTNNMEDTMYKSYIARKVKIRGQPMNALIGWCCMTWMSSIVKHQSNHAPSHAMILCLIWTEHFILQHPDSTKGASPSRNIHLWSVHWACPEVSWHGLLKIFKICLSIWFDGHLVLNRDFLVETVPNTPDHWESITWTLVQNPPSRNRENFLWCM